MKHNLQITLILVGMFLLAQLIGMLIINNYIDVQKTAETGTVTFENLPLGLKRPKVDEQTSFIPIALAIVFGTALMFIFIKIKLGKLWKLWYAAAIFFTLTIAFAAFVQPLLAAAFGIIATVWRVLKPNVIIHNLTELFIYGGLAALIAPIMNSFAAIVLLLFISLYDMYAVWKSKHMIALARFQAANKVFAGLYLPYNKIQKKLQKNMSNKKIKAAVIKNIGAKKLGSYETVNTSITSAAILGGGDIGFPLIFAGTVMKHATLLQTMLIPVGATFALFLLLLFAKQKKFYPAMPFITAGCLLGYGVLLSVY